MIAPLAIAAGAVTELVVLGELGGALPWAKPVLIGVAGACAVLLAIEGAGRYRAVVVAVAMAALLAAPSAWAVQTARPRHQQHVPGRRAGERGVRWRPRWRRSRRVRGWRRPLPAAAGSAAARAAPRARRRSASCSRIRGRAASVAVAGGFPSGGRSAGGGGFAAGGPGGFGGDSASITAAVQLRRGARRRGDRRLEPEHRGRGDPRRLHERRRPRWVLRAGELGERELDRHGGPGGSPALGDYRRHAGGIGCPGTLVPVVRRRWMWSQRPAARSR